MTPNALLRFILLAAIWGASFLFMRILAPEVGALWTAESRLAIGAVALLIYLQIRRIPLNLEHWRHYAVAGFLNCALPFSMFAVAGKLLPAGYSAVLNAAVPLWTTLFAAWFLGDKITPMRMAALALGVLGVALVAQPAADVNAGWMFIGGVAACLVATACYALTGIYLKKYGKGLRPQATATMSQTLGALLILPLALMSGVPTSISAQAAVSGLLLGLLCSGVAFLLYYRLLDEIGVVMTSGVTFLIPLFGIFWGAVLLHERLGWHVFAGCALIIGGALLLYRSNQLTTQKAKT
ncbi:transporter [Formosimonas limnophila]|uniref:Transporter n=1 Tax=Formosimonas limnophila TaxID=1384487 RepID=A0A8J3CKU7_9BURK|nr:DMT family transporter [Formosimonas limnophila]GHA73019.1 transporter [Formosimonas limnophila]